MDNGGWVPLSQVAGHPDVARICLRQPAAIAAVIRYSDLLELSSDGISVRRRGGDAMDTSGDDTGHSSPTAYDPSAPPYAAVARSWGGEGGGGVGSFMGPMALPGGEVGPCFSVVQFNCLAAHLAQPSWMPYARPEVLKWEYRFRLLMDGIHAARPDVICLQAPAPPAPVVAR
jgi:hypothetical protein